MRRAPSRAGPATSDRRALRADQDAAARDAARDRSSSTRARSWACRRSRCRSSGCRTPKPSPTGRRRLSRDGARTPMPWRSDESAARVFRRRAVACRPAKAHRKLSVDRQEVENDSLLKFTRECLDLPPRPRSPSDGLDDRNDGRRSDARVRARDRVARRCAACSICRIARSTIRPPGRAVIRTGTLDEGVLGAYSAVVEEIA